MNPQRLCALLLCSVFLGLLTLAGPLRVWSQSSAPEAPGGEVCALSDKQQADAPKAFAQMVSTFQHPRCMNCHGAVDPYSGKNHMGGKKLRENCGGCHRLPQGEWDTPEAGLFFTGKDAVQLCRQMKRTLPDGSAFIAHITEDRGRTPFIQTAFAGTRALNNLGQQMYERRTGKEYRPEPPPITHDAFIAQAEAWIDAMGGKFQGDPDCGCVPHHYSLSIDMESQGFTAGSLASHTTMSSHADIPLKFKDDASFEADVRVPITITGYERGQRSLHTGKPEDCTITGTMATKYKLSGTVDEARAVLHLVSSNGSFGGSGTATCSDGTTVTNPSPSIATPGMTWDIPSRVDVDYDFPMPGQNPPQFTSSMKFRIIQTD